MATTESTVPRPTRARARGAERALWVTPVLVWLVVARPIPLPFLNAQLALAAVVGALAVVVLHRRPALCLRLLFGLLPFSSFALAFAFRAGAPGALVGRAGLWNELVVGAVAVAALRRRWGDQLHLDLVDRVALAYVALSVVYLLDPGLLLGGAPGASIGFSGRFYGIRSDVLFVVLFLALRHLRLTRDDLARAIRALLVSFSVVGALAVVEFLFTDRWRDLVLVDLEYTDYLRRVVGTSDDVVNQLVVRFRGRVDAAVPRVGSVLLQPNSLAFGLVVPFAVAMEALVQGRRTRLAATAAALCGTGILLAQTRSVVAAAALVLVLAGRRQPGRSELARVRSQSLTVVFLVAAVPLVAIAGLTGRFSGSDTSDDLHLWSLTEGIDTLVRNPLGLGLATGAGGGARLQLEGAVKSENQYLQIGTQLGVVGMVLFVVLVVATIRLLRRRAVELGDGELCLPLLGARAAMLAFALVGLVLQPYAEVVPAWLAWGLAGAALGAVEGRAAPGGRYRRTP